MAAGHEAWDIGEELNLLLRLTDLLAFMVCDLARGDDARALHDFIDRGQRQAAQAGTMFCYLMCQHASFLAALNEGRLADAEALAMQALEGGRRIGEERALGAYGMEMFCLRRVQGRLSETLPMLRQFMQDTPKAQIWQPGLMLMYAELDQREPCRAEFDRLPWSHAVHLPTDAGTMTVVMFAAEACLYLADAQRAAQLYPLLAGHAGANLVADSAGPCLGSVDRILGGLASVMKQWSLAQRHFEAALALDERCGARVWLAYSRHAYAHMLHQRGEPGDAVLARSLLALALGESQALGMNALAPRINALLESIAAPAPTYPCGLSEREVQVLRVLAIGRNNREIAQVLDISPNTVAAHVRKILEKTYTANRTEAAAFARHEGLLAD